MFGFLKKLFGKTDAATLEQAGVKIEQVEAPYKVEPQFVEAAPAPVVETAPQRAKDANGKFVADNPATPKNEAWKDGKAPAAIKAAPKKATAKKPAAKKPAAKKSGVKKSAA